MLLSIPPDPHLSFGNHSWKGPPYSEASSLPMPHTLASPPVYSLGYRAATWQGNPSAPSFFLQGPAQSGNSTYPDPIRMLARLLLGARGGRSRGECHGSAAFTPRPKLLALVAPGLRTPLEANFCYFGWKRRCRAAPRVHVASVYPNTAPQPQPHPHRASPTELVSKWPELPKDTGKRI